MNHEIVGSEMIVKTGQLRLPKKEAIARHIAQYTSFPGGEHVHENRKYAAELETKRLNVDHELMVHFLLAGNSEMALNAAVNTERLRSDHPELFDAMEKLMSQKLDFGDRLWEGFHAVLSAVKKRNQPDVKHKSGSDDLLSKEDGSGLHHY